MKQKLTQAEEAHQRWAELEKRVMNDSERFYTEYRRQLAKFDFTREQIEQIIERHRRDYQSRL